MIPHSVFLGQGEICCVQEDNCISTMLALNTSLSAAHELFRCIMDMKPAIIWRVPYPLQAHWNNLLGENHEEEGIWKEVEPFAVHGTRADLSNTSREMTLTFPACERTYPSLFLPAFAEVPWFVRPSLFLHALLEHQGQRYHLIFSYTPPPMVSEIPMSGVLRLCSLTRPPMWAWLSGKQALKCHCHL